MEKVNKRRGKEREKRRNRRTDGSVYEPTSPSGRSLSRFP